MQTKAKSNSIVTSVIPEGTPMIDLTVRVPASILFQVLNQGEIGFDLTKVSPENHGRALLHGWNQRIPDAAAIGRTDEDGNHIPEAERTRIKAERMNDLCIHYESGTEEWSRRKEGDGTGGRSLTIEGIARAKGIEYEEAIGFVDQHAEMHKLDRKAALADIRKKSEKVRTAMAAIRLERATKAAERVTVSGDDLLDEMTPE
jgi:hypothetical protein